MKLSKLTTACALALAGFSGHALAVAPGPFDAPDIDVYLTGASAPQNFLGTLANGLFGANNPGTFNNYHVYYDNGSTIGASYRAYYGTLVAAIVVNSPTVGNVTLAAGTKVRLINRAKGGSVWGVDPVATRDRNGDNDVIDAGDTPLATAWMDPTVGTCSAPIGGQPYEYTCSEKGDDTNLANASNRLPDFGVSDVEPAIFKGPQNLEPASLALGELNTAELSTLKAGPVNGLLFGVVATTNVPTEIPFNRAMYKSLLSGDITDWTQLDASIGGNTNLVVCRRVQGSGTQAMYNLTMNNFPCGTGAIVSGSTTPLRMIDSDGYSETATTVSVNPAAGLTIIENPSSGNVRSCLDKAVTGGTHTFNYTTDANVTKAASINFGAGGYRAIAVLSADSTPNANWGFRNYHGATPNKNNMRHGQYDFFSELSMQINTEGHVAAGTVLTWTKTALNSGSAAALKNKRAFIEEFIRRAGDPAFNTGTATMALPLSFTPDETTTAGLNTGYVTRQGNSCSPVARFGVPGNPFPANISTNP